MLDFLMRLFDTSDFPARWHCGAWTPGHGWLHVLSDLGVWSAYIGIPCVLGYFVLRRRDIPFRPVFWLFAAFILACGTTHLIEAAIFWWPVYRLAGVVKLLTALVSWGTVIALVRVTPLVLSLRTPNALEREVAERTAALARANEALQAEVGERRRAEEAMRQSEQRFARFMQHLPGLAWIKDIQGRYEFINDAAEKAFRIPRAQLYGKTDAAVFPPQLAAQFQQNDQAAQASGTGLQTTETLEHEDGILHYSIVNKFPMPGPDGVTALVGGMAIDITDRINAETALREAHDQLETRVRERTAELTQLNQTLQESEERFRQAFVHAPIGMALAGLDGRWLQVNSSLCRIVGYAEGELLASTIQAITHPADLDADLAQVRRLLAGEIDSYNMEKRYIHMQGHVVWILLSVSLVHSGAGQPLHFISQIQDISARKHAEEELRQAKATADAANRAKSEFLATMSHEIRTPMNGVLGMTELALDTELTAQQRGFLTAVQGSAEALLRVINDILDFSKIEAGKLDLDPTDFHLRDSLADMLRPLAIRAERKGLELAVNVAPEVPDALTADVDRLRQILINLAGNAVKFTERGEVVIHVASEPRDPDGVMLHFTIKDTGVGVPPTKLAAIFEPFTQADSSTTREYGGSGLGLTISARLAELLGGRVWAESAVGAGSTFHFTAHCRVRHEEERPPGGLLDGLRVLVADRRAASRAALQEMLAGWRLRPTVVAGSEEAVAELGQEARVGDPYRVLVLDAGLTGADGAMFLKRLRADPALSGTLLIILAAPTRGDAERWQELGVTAILAKPVRPSQLLETIAAAVGAPTVVVNIPLHAPVPASRSLQILLAEDNVVNQHVAKHIVQAQGHQVTVVGNGREALEALDREAFDLVLMDVQMPEMDGLAATAELRRREQGTGRHVPVVALTAHAMRGDRERCLTAGMDGYLSKPVSSEAIWQAIAAAVPSAVQAATQGTIITQTKAEPVPAAAAVGRDVLDVDALLARLGGDVELLTEIVALFPGDCQRRLGELRDAIEKSDAAGLSRAAHTLKGTLGNLSAIAAYSAAERLEILARAADLTESGAAFRALVAEIDRLQSALADLNTRFPS